MYSIDFIKNKKNNLIMSYLKKAIPSVNFILLELSVCCQNMNEISKTKFKFQ